ncbi:MAG TPA: DUF2267 domain-containing protein [Thermodesulfobacteriota bacterium]|jgi:uncharacterized protein (DUF2267 family)
MTTPFVQQIIDATGPVPPEVVERATAAVFHTLRDQLTPEEADRIAAQLPGELKAMWRAGERPDRTPEKLHLEEFLERIERRAGLGSPREARWMALMVFGALKDRISDGEANDILAELPPDLEELWEEA